MAMTVERVGVAVRVTCADGTIYRWSEAGAAAYDTDQAADYGDDRITDPGSIRKGLKSWDRPISPQERCRIRVAHRLGDLWSPVTSSFKFDKALVRVWFTVEQDERGFLFDSSDDPDWVGEVLEAGAGLTDEEMALDCRDIFDEELRRKHPSEKFDIDTYPDAGDRVSGNIPLVFGVAVGGALFIRAHCIDTTTPTYKVFSTKRNDGTQDLGTDHLDGLLYVVSDPRFTPTLPLLDITKDGSYRLIPGRDFQSGEGVAHLNWIAETARTVPANKVINKSTDEATFDLDLAIRTDDQDPQSVGGDLGNDSLGRAIASDVNPESDILMFRGAGQACRNPDDDFVGYFRNPMASELFYQWMTRLSALSTTYVVPAECFASSAWSSGTATVGQVPMGAYLERQLDGYEAMGALAFEGNMAIVKRSGKLRLEELTSLPPSTPAITIGPDNIEGAPELLTERWYPYANVFQAQRFGPPDDPKYLARDVDVRDAALVTARGEVIEEYEATWLALDDLGTTPDFTNWATGKLYLLKQDEYLIRVKIRPPYGQVRDVLRIHPNDWLSFWWDAADYRFVKIGAALPFVSPTSPIAVHVVACTPNLGSKTLDAVLRWSSAGSVAFQIDTGVVVDDGRLAA